MGQRGGRLALVAVAALALAAGCGGSSSSGSSATAGQSSAAAPTKSPIKMGLLTELTGAGGSATGFVGTTAQAWVKWVNATGGLNGHPVELTVKDSKSDPASAIALANELLKTDKVDVLALADVAAEAAAGQVITSSGVPTIGFGYTPVWNSAPNMYATSGVIPLLFTSQPEAAKAVGGTAFGAIACSEVPTCSSGAQAYGPAAQAVGIKYNGLITASLTAPNYNAECLKMMQQGTDVIAATMNAPALLRLAQNCSQQGFKGSIEIGAGSVVSKDLASVTGKLAGYTWAWPWWANTPENKTLNDVMAKYNSGNQYQDASSMAMWASLEVFHKATARLGDTVSPDSLNAAMGTIQNETLGGMLPQAISFTPGKNQPVVACNFLFSYEDKKFTTAHLGASGNGTTGDTQSTCFPPK
jgi:branched-chain amino acid transport system substrate-binding protein